MEASNERLNLEDSVSCRLCASDSSDMECIGRQWRHDKLAIGAAAI